MASGVTGLLLSVGLGIYGLLLGIVIVICLLTGSLNLELHGFRLITLTQSIWFFIAGVLLWRVSSEVRLKPQE